MKRCIYCGHENEGEAGQCQKCGLGLDESYDPTPPTGNSRSSQTRLRLWLRLLAAIGVGLAVSSISLYVGWQDACDSEGARPEQWLTQHYFLREFQADIERYKTKFGSPPHSLADLLKLTNSSVKASFGDGGQSLDGWKRPIIFSNVGETFIALSYGRDAKPGGKGLDFDLTTTNIFDAQARPTFSQFLYNMPTGGVIWSCLVSGGLTFLLALLTIKLPEINRRSLFALAFKLLVTLIAASFVASIMAGLHIPVVGH